MDIVNYPLPKGIVVLRHYYKLCKRGQAMIHPYIYAGLINPMLKTKEDCAREIVRIVANYFRVEEESVFEKNRKHKVVLTRQISAYIIKHQFKMSLVDIGKLFGGQDHTTIINSIRAINNYIDTKNEEVLHHLERIKAKVAGAGIQAIKTKE